MNVPVVMIQRFCMHDGPGVRTTVFLKGCPLRCRWCHNPETQSGENQIYYTPIKCIGCGRCSMCKSDAHSFSDRGHIYDRNKCNLCGECIMECPSRALEFVSKKMTVEEIIAEVVSDKAFYGQRGGITVSGGEPMAHPEETIAILKAAKNEGLNTAVETCGYFDPKYIEELCRYTDTLLWDIKDTDDIRHKENTGVSNEIILKNLVEADKYDTDIFIRCILLKGVNNDIEHVKGVAEICRVLKNVKEVKFFPYHPMGGSKSIRLGLEDGGRRDWVLTDEEIVWAQSVFDKEFTGI